MNIKTLRKKIGKTQEEMANELGIKKQNLQNYEIGKREPNIEIMIRLSKYFGCTLDELVGNKKGTNVEISPERKELLQMVDTLTDVECHKLKIFALGMVMNRPEKGE